LGGIQKMLKQMLAEKLVEDIRKLIKEDVIVVGETLQHFIALGSNVLHCFIVLKNAYIGSRKKIYLL
jgi:hypothetical protein